MYTLRERDWREENKEDILISSYADVAHDNPSFPNPIYRSLSGQSQHFSSHLILTSHIHTLSTWICILGEGIEYWNEDKLS